MYAVALQGVDMPAVTSSSDIAVGGNTRRFVVDEERETRYRAEIHNRVYRRTLAEVNHYNGSLKV